MNFTKLENRKFFLRKEADGNQSKRLFSLFKLYNKKDLSDSTSIKSSLLTNDDTIAEQSINIYIYIHSKLLFTLGVAVSFEVTSEQLYMHI